MRLVLEADAKEFSDHHLQNMVGSYLTKLLDEFKDTVFNSERNDLEEIKANANKRGPDGWVKVGLGESSKLVAFSPNRAVGLREEVLKEEVQGLDDRGWIEGSKSPMVGRGFLVAKPGVNKWRLVIHYRHLNSCVEGHELPLLLFEDLLQRQHWNHL